MSLVPAVDWSHRGGAAVLLDAGVPVVPVPVPPVVPDPPDPTPRAEPRRYTLVAHDGLSFAPIVAFPTVDVASYVAGQLGTDAMRHRVTVASTDPAWALLCARRGVPAGAIHQVVEGVDWRLFEDGVLVASGISDGPVTSGATIDLRISGGGGILRDRFLGSGSIEDYLGGRGRWDPGSLSGWTFGGLDRRWSTTDPFAGTRVLQVRGTGWVRSPWGQSQPWDHQLAGMFSMAVVRIGANSVVGSGVEFLNVGTGQVVPRNPTFTSGYGSASPETVGWQQVDATALVGAQMTAYRTRTLIEVESPSEWVDIGLVVHRRRPASGSFPWFPLPLETLVERIVTDAQKPIAGGPLGVRVQRHIDSGASDGILWEHNRDPSVSDALSSVLGRTDSPDAWFTPDRTLHLDKRGGRDRTDLALNSDTVISASIDVDSGTRFDELRAITGYGAGPTRAVVAYDGEGVPGAPRRRALFQAPNELSFRSAEAWIEGHGEFVSRQQMSLRVVVPDWYGRAFAPGDGVRVALDVDGWTIRAAMRVGQITVQPTAGTVVLELGFDEKVNLP